ncbi:MAG: N-acetylmuramoyl-L-alanine amidase [Planctomycetota bacterium]|jgi:N-acetylmuramoyl-L-alanine amidase
MKRLLSLVCAALLGSCAATPEPYVDPRHGNGVVGEFMLVAGEPVNVGVPVVLWTEAPFYSAYNTGPRFADEGEQGLRYKPGREAAGRNPDRVALEQVVDQFVLHYDACGVSRTCFRVLHDQRGLSVHFLLDVDGTIYQTMDLEDTAWHARQANSRSVGVEIANLGAYSVGKKSPLDEWYGIDDEGLILNLPARLGDGGVRDMTQARRPARASRVAGEVQGGFFEQVDFTDAQYESLAHLTAALVSTFPRMELRVPRAPDGLVLNRRMDEGEEDVFGGLVGHLHVSSSKLDPGPAFNWAWLLERASELL